MKSPLKTSKIRSVAIRWRLWSSRMLDGETCYYVTNVSGQPIGPIFQGAAVAKQVALTDYGVKLYQYFGRYCTIVRVLFHSVYQAVSTECFKFMGWMYSKTAISSTPIWLHQWRDSLWKSSIGTGTVKIFRWNLNRLHTSLIKNNFTFMPPTFMSSKWTLSFTFYYQQHRMHFSTSPYVTHDPSISSF
jgi:hypothetical protein